MARNAQMTGGTTPTTPYQSQPPLASESVKNPFSTINLSRDPVQAAAAQWAQQSASNFENPPSYNSSVSNSQPRQNWDQSFVNEVTPNRTGSIGVKPPPNDPHNPFQ